MRILKEIPHKEYKISILTYNDKFIVRIVNSGVAIDLTIQEDIAKSVSDAEKWLESGILNEIQTQFAALHKLRIDAARKLLDRNDNGADFPNII